MTRSLNDHPLAGVLYVLAAIATIVSVAVPILRARSHDSPSPPGPSVTYSPTYSPTTVPPVATTPRPAPAPGLPAALVGHWEGEGQSDADNYLRFTIALDLRSGRVGSVVGSARFEGNFHAGSFGSPAQFNLRLTGLTADGVRVAEQGGFSDVVLQLDSGTITYHARNSGEPVYWVTATLSRIS